MSIYFEAVGVVVSVEPFPANQRHPRAIVLSVKQTKNDAEPLELKALLWQAARNLGDALKPDHFIKVAGRSAIKQNPLRLRMYVDEIWAWSDGQWRQILDDHGETPAKESPSQASNQRVAMKSMRQWLTADRKAEDRA